LIGVDETRGEGGVQQGVLSGSNISDETRRTLVQQASSCRPTIDVSIRAENTGTSTPILRLDIPEGSSKPHATSSGTYKWRADGQNVGIDPEMLRTIVFQAESEEFVARFKSAADEVVGVLTRVHDSLASQNGEIHRLVELAQ